MKERKKTKKGYYKLKKEAIREAKEIREEVTSVNFAKKPFLRMHEIDIDKQREQEQTCLTIEDTEVYFPFQVYPQQIEYMK